MKLKALYINDDINIGKRQHEAVQQLPDLSETKLFHSG